MMAHLEACSTFKYIAVDTEGYAPNILGISVAHPALQSMYFPIHHKEDVNIDEETENSLRKTLWNVPYRIMHNAGHDLIALPDLFDLPFIDTMIMGHMVDENVISKSLDWMHKTYCPNSKYSGKEIDPMMASILKIYKDDPRKGWEMIPYFLLSDYGAVDATITMELFQALLPKYEEQFGPMWSPSENPT